MQVYDCNVLVLLLLFTVTVTATITEEAAPSRAAGARFLQTATTDEVVRTDLVRLIPFDVQIAIQDETDVLQENNSNGKGKGNAALYSSALITDTITDWMMDSFVTKTTTNALTASHVMQQHNRTTFDSIALELVSDQTTNGTMNGQALQLVQVGFEGVTLWERIGTGTLPMDPDLVELLQRATFLEDKKLKDQLQRTIDTVLQSAGLDNSTQAVTIVDVRAYITPTATGATNNNNNNNNNNNPQQPPPASFNDNNGNNSNSAVTTNQNLEIIIIVAIVVACLAFALLIFAVIWAWRSDNHRRETSAAATKKYQQHHYVSSGHHNNNYYEEEEAVYGGEAGAGVGAGGSAGQNSHQQKAMQRKSSSSRNKSVKSNTSKNSKKENKKNKKRGMGSRATTQQQQQQRTPATTNGGGGVIADFPLEGTNSYPSNVGGETNMYPDPADSVISEDISSSLTAYYRQSNAAAAAANNTPVGGGSGISYGNNAITPGGASSYYHPNQQQQQQQHPMMNDDATMSSMDSYGYSLDGYAPSLGPSMPHGYPVGPLQAVSHAPIPFGTSTDTMDANAANNPAQLDIVQLQQDEESVVDYDYDESIAGGGTNKDANKKTASTPLGIGSSEEV